MGKQRLNEFIAVAMSEGKMDNIAFARKIGISPITFARYLRDNKFQRRALSAIAKYLKLGYDIDRLHDFYDFTICKDYSLKSSMTDEVGSELNGGINEDFLCNKQIITFMGNVKRSQKSSIAFLYDKLSEYDSLAFASLDQRPIEMRWVELQEQPYYNSVVSAIENKAIYIYIRPSDVCIRQYSYLWDGISPVPTEAVFESQLDKFRTAIAAALISKGMTRATANKRASEHVFQFYTSDTTYFVPGLTFALFISKTKESVMTYRAPSDPSPILPLNCSEDYKLLFRRYLNNVLAAQPELPKTLCANIVTSQYGVHNAKV